MSGKLRYIVSARVTWVDEFGEAILLTAELGQTQGFEAPESTESVLKNLLSKVSDQVELALRTTNATGADQ